MRVHSAPLSRRPWLTNWACVTQSESIPLSALGAHSSSNRQLPMANINIVTTNGEHIPVCVLIIEQIATPLQNHFRHQVRIIPHLRGLQLAHPVMSDENFEILLLTGADHYWDIVKDTVIHGQGPTAVESKPSYLTSGPLHTDCVNCTDTVVNLLQWCLPQQWQNVILSISGLWSLSASHHLQKRMTRNTSRDPQSQECLMAVTAPNFHGRKIIPHCLPTIVAGYDMPSCSDTQPFLNRTEK